MVDDTELTVRQAAEMLGVTCEFAGRLVEDNRLPHRVVHGSPRIRMTDMMAYRDERIRKGEALLNKIATDSEEMGLYGHRP